MLAKKALKLAGIGFLLGIVIGNVIAWATGRPGSLVSLILIDRMGGETPAVLMQVLFSGLYGAATMSGVVLYDVERFPLALSTALHCLICVVPYIPLALLLGWAQKPSEILITACFQVIAFFLIWLIMYLRCKAEVRKLNELQKEKEKGGENT